MRESRIEKIRKLVSIGREEKVDTKEEVVLDEVEEVKTYTHSYCIINGNGYNVIKNAITEVKPMWREIKKEELWTRMGNPNFVINFIWKPVNFSKQVSSHFFLMAIVQMF